MAQPNSSRHHRHSHRNRSGDSIYKMYVEPAAFITLPIIIILIAKMTHTSQLLATIGAFSVVAITVAKIVKSQTAFFFSVLAILALSMYDIWLWTEQYLIQIITVNLISNPDIFYKGLSEGILVICLLYLYKRQLSNFKMKVRFEWYSATSYTRFIGILFYFFVFLTLFMVLAYFSHKVLAGMSYEKMDITIGVAIASLVLTSIPAILHLFKTPPEPKNRSRHTHRRNQTQTTD